MVGGRWNLYNEFGWEPAYELTPTNYEGYVFVPVNIQITRTEGTLHIVNRHSNGLGGMSLPGLLFTDRKPHIPSILFLRIFPIFMDGDYDIMILYY